MVLTELCMWIIEEVVMAASSCLKPEYEKGCKMHLTACLGQAYTQNKRSIRIQ